MTRTWLITGASRGIGAEIGRAALRAGHNLVAAARDTALIERTFEQWRERLLPVSLDITEPARVEAAVAAAKERFSGIDVLVNNAGYGQLGTFEEMTPEEVGQQFATNVFGTFNMTRSVLPIMRAQRSGHIFTVSSLAGLISFEGSSIYSASKFALEGWMEGLQPEIARFGIHATLIEPGSFRTDFLETTSVRYGSVQVPDYAATSAERNAMIEANNHQQPGDPVKLGEIVVKLAELPSPPLRFAAGSDCLAALLGKAEQLRRGAEEWRELTVSTDL